MKFKDYYKILELDTYKISNDEIKIAYRKQAKKFHPDINVNDRFAEERFKDINEAYNVLTDKNKKRKYDRMWISYKSKDGSFDASEFVKKYEVNTEAFSEFFEIFFGKKKEEKKPGFSIKKNKMQMVGEDVETEIEITLEDAFYGATKTLAFRTVKGSMKNITVKIPEGIRQGEKIRIGGQGKPGLNGGRDGDLYIKVKMLPHLIYSLDGANLVKDLKITPWEAALGTNIDVEYLDGNAKITIPPGMQSGDKLRLPRKGYKTGIGGRGDLVLEVKIQVPKNLDSEEKMLFEKLSQISKFKPRN